jgi:hypothetical protein
MRHMNDNMTVAEMLDAKQKKAEQGPWLPACGGTEVPFKTRTGMTLLYCWQPSTGRHAYINVDTDLVLTDEEAWLALGNR